MNGTEDIVEFMCRHRELECECNRIRKRVKVLEVRCTRKTKPLSAMIVSSSRPDVEIKDIYLDELDGLREKMKQSVAAKKEIEAFINSVDGSVNRLILRLWYLEGCDWGDVREAMEGSKYYYTESHIRHVLRRKALDAARKAWDENLHRR